MREDRPIPKAIVAVTLCYGVSVISGFIWLAIMMKGQGYADGNPARLVWTWSAVFLREWWWLFFLLLVAWVVYALRAERKDHGWLSADAAIVIGILMTIAVGLWFVITALNPVARRPLLYLLGQLN